MKCIITSGIIIYFVLFTLVFLVNYRLGKLNKRFDKLAESCKESKETVNLEKSTS